MFNKMPAQIGRLKKSTLYEGVLNRFLDIMIIYDFL